MCGGWGRKAALCGLPRFLRLDAFLAVFGLLATLAGWGALGRGGHAALCNLPRFLRPLGRSQRLRRAGWGAVHAAFCSLPRFLRPLGRSQRLREGALGRGGMPRFAACRVSCGLWAARNACVGGVRWGVRGMPRFATCRVSCGLWAARNACFLCCGTGIWGAAPNPGKGLRPLHPALLSPYLTTLLLSLRISSVTPSGGSPNVALSVLLPPSHVSCIAISRASIRQPSSTTVTISPTS